MNSKLYVMKGVSASDGTTDTDSSVLGRSRERTSSSYAFGIGPGETVGQPFSVMSSSRGELIKVVVSFTILWLTIAVKVQETVARVNALQKNEPRDEDQKNANGYDDIMVGNEFVLDTNLLLSATLYYNGYKVSQGSVEHYLTTSGSGSLSSEDLKSLQLPVPGLYRVLLGMKEGGIRRAVLPPIEAFSSKGLAPFVPPYAHVTYEIRLEKY